MFWLLQIITGDEGGALPWKASSIDHYQGKFNFCGMIFKGSICAICRTFVSLLIYLAVQRT